MYYKLIVRKPVFKYYKLIMGKPVHLPTTTQYENSPNFPNDIDVCIE